MSVRRESGFSLLEVMVAFVVLAVALGLLLGMLSRGLKQVTQAGNETEASLHAQSLLDALGTLEPLQAGVREGEFAGGRYHWRLDVAAAEDPAPPQLTEAELADQPVFGLGAPMLYRVALDVAWGAGTPAQQLHYVSLRLRAGPTDGAAAGAPAGAAP